MNESTIYLQTANGKVPVRGFRTGAFAAHHSINGNGWSVSHFESGLATGHYDFQHEEDAMKLALDLDRSLLLQTLPKTAKGTKEQIEAIKKIVANHAK